MRTLLFSVFLILLFACHAQRNKKLPPYEDLKTEVAAQRSAWNTAYLAADETTKEKILDSAETYLLETITTDFFDQWYGTEWDFNGTTKTPRKGKIACGYFITTVLTDAGFNMPRVKWAQQASEYYITRMTSDVKRFSGATVEKVSLWVQNRPDGLYLAGLDNHVGFIHKSGDEIRFIHASYYDPKIGVQSEELDGDNPFAKSQYRVIGRILGKEMVRKWILGEAWEE